MRTFLAINLDHIVKEDLMKIQEELKGRIKGIRWVNPQLLHITLKFLGETDNEQVEMMENPLRELAKKTASFRVSLARLGAFPSSTKPRVIWIGTGEGTAELGSLAKGIGEIFKDLHPSFNGNAARIRNEKFRPHLTIGRRNKNKVFDAEPLIFKERWECRNRLYVDSFYLMKSILRPTGPLYIPLQEFLLNKM